jgi:hypothetical protein
LQQLQNLNQLFVFDHVSNLRRECPPPIEYVPSQRNEEVEQNAVVETKAQPKYVYGNQFEGDILIHFRGDYLEKQVQHIPLPTKFHDMKISLIFSRGFLEKFWFLSFWNWITYIPWLGCFFDLTPKRTFIEFIQSVRKEGGDVNIMIDTDDSSWETHEAIRSHRMAFQLAEQRTHLNDHMKQRGNDSQMTKSQVKHQFILVSQEKAEKCMRDLSTEHISVEKVAYDYDCVLIDFSEN